MTMWYRRSSAGGLVKLRYLGCVAAPGFLAEAAWGLAQLWWHLPPVVPGGCILLWGASSVSPL